MSDLICTGCGRRIEGEPSAGMNLPGVTDGPAYWCESCAPPLGFAETVAFIESFVDPPKEMP